MPNIFVQNIIDKIKTDFGSITRIGDGNSLYEIKCNGVLIYFRYSKLTKKSNGFSGFYGLRKEDIDLLKDKKSFICFVWDREDSPILIPFKNFEYNFTLFPPSNDGQFKAHIILKNFGSEFYLANVGKFNVESFYGLSQLYEINKYELEVPELSHTQVQSIIGAIGIKKGFNLWFPESDKPKIQKGIIEHSNILRKLPIFSREIDNIVSEIDVIWFQNSKPISLFEVEHSTSIYSGLLRFNDVLLTIAGIKSFNIVALKDREGKFSREINRPTFKQNNLIDKVTFLDYNNIYHWFYNVYGKTYSNQYP